MHPVATVYSLDVHHLGLRVHQSCAAYRPSVFGLDAACIDVGVGRYDLRIASDLGYHLIETRLMWLIIRRAYLIDRELASVLSIFGVEVDKLVGVWPQTILVPTAKHDRSFVLATI